MLLRRTTAKSVALALALSVLTSVAGCSPHNATSDTSTASPSMTAGPSEATSPPASNGHPQASRSSAPAEGTRSTGHSPAPQAPLPPTTPALPTGAAAQEEVPPSWAEEFDTLDLASSENPDAFWRANDVWQPLDAGHQAFDGARPATWFLNPAQMLAEEPRSPFSISDGVLTIAARRTPDAWVGAIASHNTQNQGYAPPWTGGRLVSNTQHPEGRFGYGYYEVRARMPQPIQGAWPAVWFFSAHEWNPGKSAAEIDLIEVFGYPTGAPWSVTLHQRTVVDGAVVTAPVATNTSGQIDVSHTFSDITRWHTYGMDWQEGELRFYLDDDLVAEASSADAEFFNGVTMSIRLDLAVDASWFPAGQRTNISTPDTFTFEVDYIRRWETRPRA